MSTTETATIYKALLAARAEFSPVIKDKKNPHFKSMYATLEAVLDAVSESLYKNGLVLIQSPDCGPEGAVLVTQLVEVTSGTSIACRYPLTPVKPNDPQALASALTYARRYSALSLLGIAPEDDDGNAATEKPAPAKVEQKPKPVEQPRPISNEQRASIDKLAASLGVTSETVSGWVKQKFGIDSWHSLTYRQASEVINGMEARLQPA